MTTAEINLYGRKLTIRPVWFLAQGYCEDAASHNMEEAVAGRYDPDAFAVWMATHSVTCRQCRDANCVKGSILEFLRIYHPEWVERYKQGYMPPTAITRGWINHIRGFRRDALKAFGRISEQIKANAAEFKMHYGG